MNTMCEIRWFSIKELERFSGIKAHTIRAWEHRYKVFIPKRTTGNIRLYTIEDVIRLLDLSLLIENGFRISSLVKLNAEELELKTRTMLTHKAEKHKAIYSMIISMFKTDIDTFEDQLDSCIKSWSLDATIQEIIIPFLDKVDILSYKDDSAAVHFVVTAVRKKLILGIESLKGIAKPSYTALLFLPQNEHYDLLLLYMTYVIKCKGLGILYLGTNVSTQNLIQVMTDKKPDYLFTHLPVNYTFDAKDVATLLNEHFSHARLFIAESENITRKFTSRNPYYFYYRHVDSVLSDISNLRDK